MMPTRSQAPKGSKEKDMIEKVIMVPETCPDLSPFTQEREAKTKQSKDATPDSKTLSYDMTSSPQSKKNKNMELTEDCSSPPYFTRVKQKTNSVSILTTTDRDFIHMLIQDSYNLIDTSNANTVKELMDKVKRKETHLLSTHSKALIAAKEEVSELKNERDVLRAQLEESRKTMREIKASVSCQVSNQKQKSKIEIQKLELELTKIKMEKSDYVTKKNSSSVTHDLKHEQTNIEERRSI